ncbi:MAG: dihydroorotase [Clostridiales bacterium]|nr:MAG: dihydroorotase [Clostridiales bacterium]
MILKETQSQEYSNLTRIPAFIDMHVHLRDPGQTYKETILSGSRAAKAGGFSHILCMPNTTPVIDTPEMIQFVLSRPAEVAVLPIASITKGQQGSELTDFAALKKAGAVAFSDDGVPVSDSNLMRQAMYKAIENNALIISHCENKSLIPSKLQSPPEAEYTAIDRECALAIETGARLHIAHISTKESVDIIRNAKRKGANVTCETCPHYFSLTESDYKNLGTNAMMNPPLRKKEDVTAIISGIVDGTIDVVSTDHAPHSISEKDQPAELAPFGIIGLETSFCVSYTFLVKTGIIKLERLIELMSDKPKEILGIHSSSFVLADLETEFIYDISTSQSLSRNSPYDKMRFFGKILKTVLED